MNDLAYLVLRLDAPLQRWGESAKWEIYDTAKSPTKSGVVGLIANALGFDIEGPILKEINNSVKMGVRVDRVGTILVDFNTVQPLSFEYDKYTKGIPRADKGVRDPRLNDILIRKKQYMQDAAYTVVLEGARADLDRYAEAIQNPVFKLFLGAKSCPPTTRIFDYISDKYTGLKNALQYIPLSPRADKVVLSIAGVETEKTHYYCEWECVTGNKVRRDVANLDTLRTYSPRRVMAESIEVITPVYFNSDAILGE